MPDAAGWEDGMRRTSRSWHTGPLVRQIRERNPGLGDSIVKGQKLTIPLPPEKTKSKTAPNRADGAGR